MTRQSDTPLRFSSVFICVHRCRKAFSPLFALLFAVLSIPAAAEVTVKDAWARGTVAAQSATGAFMTITSAQAAKLVGAKSTLGTAELHEMKMEGGVMTMREAGAIALPAGTPVELKPGAVHVMITGLAKPLGAGDTVPITLTVEGTDGKRSTVEVNAAVRPLGSGDGPPAKPAAAPAPPAQPAPPRPSRGY